MGIEARASGGFYERPVGPTSTTAEGSRVWLLYVAAAVMATAAVVGALGRVPAANAEHPVHPAPAVHAPAHQVSHASGAR
jgi:hypothetical protein